MWWWFGGSGFFLFLFYYTHVFSYGVRLRGLSEECIDNKEGESGKIDR